jgi:hypothetical protein
VPETLLSSPLPCWHESLHAARTDLIVSLSPRSARIATGRPVPVGTPVFLELARDAGIDAIAVASDADAFVVEFVTVDDAAAALIATALQAPRPPLPRTRTDELGVPATAPAELPPFAVETPVALPATERTGEFLAADIDSAIAARSDEDATTTTTTTTTTPTTPAAFVVEPLAPLGEVADAPPPPVDDAPPAWLDGGDDEVAAPFTLQPTPTPTPMPAAPTPETPSRTPETPAWVRAFGADLGEEPELPATSHTQRWPTAHAASSEDSAPVAPPATTTTSPAAATTTPDWLGEATPEPREQAWPATTPTPEPEPALATAMPVAATSTMTTPPGWLGEVTPEPHEQAWSTPPAAPATTTPTTPPSAWPPGVGDPDDDGTATARWPAARVARVATPVPSAAAASTTPAAWSAGSPAPAPTPTPSPLFATASSTTASSTTPASTTPASTTPAPTMTAPITTVPRTASPSPAEETARWPVARVAVAPPATPTPAAPPPTTTTPAAPPPLSFEDAEDVMLEFTAPPRPAVVSRPLPPPEDDGVVEVDFSEFQDVLGVATFKAGDPRPMASSGRVSTPQPVSIALPRTPSTSHSPSPPARNPFAGDSGVGPRPDSTPPVSPDGSVDGVEEQWVVSSPSLPAPRLLDRGLDRVLRSGGPNSVTPQPLPFHDSTPGATAATAAAATATTTTTTTTTAPGPSPAAPLATPPVPTTVPAPLTAPPTTPAPHPAPAPSVVASPSTTPAVQAPPAPRITTVVPPLAPVVAPRPPAVVPVVPPRPPPVVSAPPRPALVVPAVASPAPSPTPVPSSPVPATTPVAVATPMTPSLPPVTASPPMTAPATTPSPQADPPPIAADEHEVVTAPGGPVSVMPLTSSAEDLPLVVGDGEDVDLVD